MEQACLALQDRDGADVILALTLIWAGIEGIEADNGTLDRLLELSRHWQGEVIGPLREARRALKPAPDNSAQELRARIKTLELEAERLAQEAMVALLPPRRAHTQSAATRAARNLALYLCSLTPVKAPPGEAGVLLAAALPDLDAGEIARAFTRA